MEWWDALWLNEGFATWCENFAVDRFFPEWKMWDQFVYSDLNSSFELDALSNSHPIEVPIYDAADVDEIFDTISYSKGCVVIRMLESFLGAEQFRAGMIVYMKRYASRNAKTEDLWATLSEVSGVNVRDMMHSWTQHTGFPIIQIEENSSASSDILTYRVKQTRFLQTGPDANSKVTWPVPIDFVVSGQRVGDTPIGKQIFSASEGELLVDLKSTGISSPAWIKLNGAQASMYRVQYPPKMFTALCAAVAARDPLLTGADRLGVQNDAFALTRCGLLTTVQLLELVRSYDKEDDYTVWADLCANLSDISILLQSDDSLYALFCRFVNRLLSPILAKVGWDAQPDEGHTTSLLRAKIIGVSAKYGEPTTIATGLKKFAAYMASGKAVDTKAEADASAEVKLPASSSSVDSASKILSPDLRSSVYGMVVSRGGEFGYECMLHLRSSVTLSEEAVRCLNALGATRDSALLRRTLDYSLTPEVRTQDGSSLIRVVAANRYGSQLCWEWTKSNWDAIVKKYGGAKALTRIVGQCDSFSSQAQLSDAQAFFRSHEHLGAERTVLQAIERIHSNLQWVERDFAPTAEWLRANVAANDE